MTRALFHCVAIGAFVFCAGAQERPNFLVCISDDQSYPHASAYGYEAIETPGFDRVAEQGVLFNNAFTPAPGCSPMRAAFLTGRHIWQIEAAGTHASDFPKKYQTYPHALESAGYRIGATGKLWGPGNWKVSGRTRNPAGPSIGSANMDSPDGIRNTDYATNFETFLESAPASEPFCFWYGASEPHRSFKRGIGRENGMDPSKVEVPSFLPDTELVRNDILDYLYEIQWFDQHLNRMLDALEAGGRLENTVVIVSSDNGMAFPRAKANVYEYGIHMPLAIRWDAGFPGGRVVDDLVNLIDVTATIYDLASAAPSDEFELSGRSLASLLRSEKEGVVEPARDIVFSGRERHSSSRYLTLGYPQRAARTSRYLYIQNLRPERWPAGAPRKFGTGGYASKQELENRVLGPMHGGYHDIDACPTMDELIERRDDPRIGRFLELAVAKRPAEELYDIVRDPGCLNNLAERPSFQSIKESLETQLVAYLEETQDPRALGNGDMFETYPRYSSLRMFPTPEWVEEDPDRAPAQEWVKERLGVE